MQMGAPDIPEAQRQLDLNVGRESKKRNLGIGAGEGKKGNSEGTREISTNDELRDETHLDEDEDVYDEDLYSQMNLNLNVCRSKVYIFVTCKYFIYRKIIFERKNVRKIGKTQKTIFFCIFAKIR